MHFTNTFLLLIVAIGHPQQIYCSNRRLTITNMTYHFNSDLFQNVSILLKNSKFNVHLEVIKSIERALIEFTVFLKLSDRDGYTNFVNTRLELCTFLRNPLTTEPLLAFVHRSVMMNQQNRIFEKCPIKPVYTRARNAINFHQ